MGIAAAAAGAGVAAGVSAGGQGIFSALAAHKAYKRTKAILKNQIQWRVNDLEGAGLNKYLAVTGGMGGGSASVPMASQIAPPDIGRGASSAKGVKTMSDEVKIMKSNVKTAANQAETSFHKTHQTIAESESANNAALSSGLQLKLDQEGKPWRMAVEGMKNRSYGIGARTLNRAIDSYGLEQRVQNAAKRGMR